MGKVGTPKNCAQACRQGGLPAQTGFFMSDGECHCLDYGEKRVRESVEMSRSCQETCPHYAAVETSSCAFTLNLDKTRKRNSCSGKQLDETKMKCEEALGKS